MRERCRITQETNVEASIKYLPARDETSFVSRARQNEDAANIRDYVDQIHEQWPAASKYNSESAIVCKQPDFAGICEPREAAELRSAFSPHANQKYKGRKNFQKPLENDDKGTNLTRIR